MSEPNYDSFGYALAMGVLQSDLYHKLEDRARAECDEMILRGQGRSQHSKSGSVPAALALLDEWIDTEMMDLEEYASWMELTARVRAALEGHKPELSKGST